jgi:hypothetical protein
VGGCGLLISVAKMVSVVTLTNLLKFSHRKYASLVNIDVGTLLQIAQQKTAKTIKKYSKNIFPTYRPQLPQVFF